MKKVLWIVIVVSIILMAVVISLDYIGVIHSEIANLLAFVCGTPIGFSIVHLLIEYDKIKF